MSGRTDDPDENGLTNAMWNDIIRASYTENSVIQGAIEQAIVNAVKVASRFARIRLEVRASRFALDGCEDRMVIPDHMGGVEVVWRELWARADELEAEAFRELRGRLAGLAVQND